MRHVLALLALSMACPAIAVAAERDWHADGPGVSVSGTCAAAVTITGGGRGVFVHGEAGDPAELDRLVLETSGNVAALRPATPGARCAHPGAPPTLRLAVTVPDGAAITVRDGGGVAYRIGAVAGPLTVALAGGATLEDAASGRTDLELGGAPHVTLGHVAGDLGAELDGGGVLHVTRIEAATVTLRLAGTAGVAVDGGTIDALAIEGSGAGTVAIGAAIGRARVELAGSTVVRLPHLRGPLAREVAGTATVETGP